MGHFSLKSFLLGTGFGLSLLVVSIVLNGTAPLVAFAQSNSQFDLNSDGRINALDMFSILPYFNSQSDGSQPILNMSININTQSNVLSYNVSYANLSGPETASHIHDAGGEIVYDFGQSHPQTSPKVGSWNYSEGLEQQILGGQMYVNIHTAQNPSGEVKDRKSVV